MHSSTTVRRSGTAIALVAMLILLGGAGVKWNHGRRKPAKPDDLSREAATASALPAPALPVDPPAPAWSIAPAPSNDLEFVGILATNSRRTALFALTAPGRSAARFALVEGEENEWLHVRGIDHDRGTVTVVLKRPVNRNRNVDSEMLMSLKPPAPVNPAGADTP